MSLYFSSTYDEPETTITLSVPPRLFSFFGREEGKEVDVNLTKCWRLSFEGLSQRLYALEGKVKCNSYENF